MTNPLPKLAKGEDLSAAEAKAFADALFEGLVPEGLLGGVLTALAIKGETVPEITAFARSMREHARDFGFMAPESVDTCGTGGSGMSAYNAGTLSSLVLAAAGGKAAKHGNRAITGKAGSADLIERLGIPLEPDNALAKKLYDEAGFVFLFAPACHPAMKYAMPVRKTLGIPTVFNLLGPLTNPLGARRHMMGVGRRDIFDSIVQTLTALGMDRAVVLQADSGMDEVDVSGPTKAMLIEGEVVKSLELSPESLGLSRHPLEELVVQSPEHSLDLTQAVLRAEPSAVTDFVLANAGVALFVAGLAPDPKNGVNLARELLSTGKVADVIERIKKVAA